MNQNAISRIETVWCRVMHSGTTWPIHGHYQCTTCGRSYQVPWSNSSEWRGNGGSRNASAKSAPAGHTVALA